MQEPDKTDSPLNLGDIDPERLAELRRRMQEAGADPALLGQQQHQEQEQQPIDLVARVLALTVDQLAQHSEVYNLVKGEGARLGLEDADKWAELLARVEGIVDAHRAMDLTKTGAIVDRLRTRLQGQGPGPAMQDDPIEASEAKDLVNELAEAMDDNEIDQLDFRLGSLRVGMYRRAPRPAPRVRPSRAKKPQGGTPT